MSSEIDRCRLQGACEGNTGRLGARNTAESGAPDNLQFVHPLVSVIIPCYNQGHFLSDAIESVLHQSYKCFEIIVVNDGSSDNTRDVAARYQSIRYVEQENRGLAGARNAGMKESRGQYLVFLDADDLLWPEALQKAVEVLHDHPECAFASGQHRVINNDLTPRFKYPSRPLLKDHYLTLLRFNYIGMHATVMYRREALEAIGGFDESLSASEDYDVYLKITRTQPVISHPHIVADYRRHTANMSLNPKLMLDCVLRVHNAQLQYVSSIPALAAAHAEGAKGWRRYYATNRMERLWSRVRSGHGGLLLTRRLLTMIRSYLSSGTWSRAVGAAVTACKRQIRHAFVSPRLGAVELGSFSAPNTLFEIRQFDESIEGALSNNFVLTQIADLTGTAIRIEANGDDFTKLETIDSESCDYVICEWQLQRAWNPSYAIGHLKRILKPSGVLVATVPGVVVSSRCLSEKDYWRFTKLGAQRLFAEHFFSKSLTIVSLGNVLTAAATLHNVPPGHLYPNEFAHIDERHPVVIGIRAVKQ